MTDHAYETVCEEIARAASRSGRDLSSISLVAVTKQVSWQEVEPLYALGIRDFAENRVGEALRKQNEAPSDCRWHLIGTLQSNKVAKALGKFVLIHSIDNYALAEKISETSQRRGVITPILLQANTSGEESKHGLSPEEWKYCFEKVLQLKGVHVEGLMTMAPITRNPIMRNPLCANQDEVRTCFRKLRLLRDALSLMSGKELPHLSMGMSQDFVVAIEEGATLLRIGSALFRSD